MRMAGLLYGIELPRAADVAVTGIPRLGRGHAVDNDGGNSGNKQLPNPPDGSSGEQSTTHVAE
jgi:hypothetical protein